MKYYAPDTVRSAIKHILSDEWKPHPNIPDETREDALLYLFSSMTSTVYAAGALEVQQGIIKALGLRHLLGIDAR